MFWLQVCAVSFGEFCSVTGRRNTEESLVSYKLGSSQLFSVFADKLFVTASDR